MAKDKRLTKAYEAVDETKAYPLPEAIKLVKQNAKAKFDETVEMSMNLGIDPRHADQMVRGLTSLPNGTGKTVRVGVFARGPKADEAQAAGADVVGAEDLAEKVQAGEIGFDRCIATPDMMGVVGRLGKILGPRGLMPNPRLGTVTMDVKGAVSRGEGRPGRVPRREGRHHPRRYRQGQLRRRQAGGECPGTGRRDPEGEAGRRQGHLPAEGFGELDDGARRAGGRREFGNLGDFRSRRLPIWTQQRFDPRPFAEERPQFVSAAGRQICPQQGEANEIKLRVAAADAFQVIRDWRQRADGGSEIALLEGREAARHGGNARPGRIAFGQGQSVDLLHPGAQGRSVLGYGKCKCNVHIGEGCAGARERSLGEVVHDPPGFSVSRLSGEFPAPEERHGVVQLAARRTAVDVWGEGVVEQIGGRRSVAGFEMGDRKVPAQMTVERAAAWVAG